MAEVQRGNVYLTIPDEDIKKYMAKGYSVVDPVTGKVIKQSVPTELGQLQKAYSDHVEIIKNLTAENERLKSELAKKATGAATKAPVEPEKVEEPEEVEDQGWDDWSDAEEVEEQPKPKKKKSKA